MPHIIGENVDRLVTVEMRSKGIVRGNIVELYAAARHQLGEPLTMLAAKRLREAVKPGDAVIIATGAGSWPWMPHGETDGPPGAASLARAITLGLGGRPVIVSDDRKLPAIAASCRAVGLLVGDADMMRARTGVATMVPFTTEEANARAEAEALLDEWQPRAVIAIENLGPNAKGEFHSLQGINASAGTARVHHLFELAMARGMTTIGVGDGGNEIGCGLIYEDTRRIMPAGSHCQCPCGDGMATVVSTDVLVIGSSSNWAAYGISACLAFLLGDNSLLQDAATERRVVEQCALSGASDGMSALPVPWVDGTSLEVQEAVVTMLGMIVSNGLRTIQRPF
jgi:D-glutamate cyclase